MKKLSQNEFITRIINVHGDRYILDNTVYTGALEEVKVICRKHGEYSVKAHKLLSGQRCKKCFDESQRKTYSTFKKDVKAIHPSNINVDNFVYVDAHTKGFATCTLHTNFSIIPNSLLRGAGCPKCSGNASKTLREWITSFKDKHGAKYKYSEINTVVNAVTKVSIICSEHGIFKMTPNNHLSGQGCPKCNRSKGELKIIRFLEKTNIKFIEQYKIIDSRYRYDFLLTDLNILIEYDGIQHSKPIDRFGGAKQFKIQKLNDKAKDELTSLHNIPLIRIPYTHYKDLDSYLLWKLSKIYKYRVGDKFYKNFLEVCRGEQLPASTTSKNLKKILLLQI